MNQLALPVEVAPAEIIRKGTFGAAVALTYEVAGLCPKTVLADCRFDKGQLSRWESGTEGVNWPKLQALMDRCGNDVPVLWQLHQRGYDITAVRKRESELERQLRVVTEERDALKRVLLSGSVR